MRPARSKTAGSCLTHSKRQRKAIGCVPDVFGQHAGRPRECNKARYEAAQDTSGETQLPVLEQTESSSSSLRLLHFYDGEAAIATNSPILTFVVPI
jgi:hypothetical protein